MTELVIDAHTRAQQAKASDPAQSAWVSANAGSGKTFVLSRRIARLLLAGTDPSCILALTFTKAAAGEMSNRVLEILGEWVTLSDQQLRETLRELEGSAPRQEQIDRARTLFARALETPGGLKIQTIHAFCEALLHQFPLEANVPGNFSVMDDAAQARALNTCRTNIVLKADEEPNSAIGKAFSTVLDVASDSQIEKAFKEIITHREALAKWLEDAGGPQKAEAMARKVHGFSPDETEEDVYKSIAANTGLANIEFDHLYNVCIALDESKAGEMASTITEIRQAKDAREFVEAIKPLVLTKPGELRKFGRYPSKAICDGYPGIKEILEGEAEALVAQLARFKTLQLITCTTPLMVLAEAMINQYTLTKRSQSLLDFDDLVARTVDLLVRSDARRWVLYKLDLGIDHILLDEAQDTSPSQWQVISSLVEEFFAGSSARNVNRTVFAVGDEKQSIYSFQGAMPASFALQRKVYERAAKAVGKPFEPLNLAVSFRSTQDVLDAVDTVFSLPENAKGLTFDGDYQKHTAARRNQPGTIDVWDLEFADEQEPPESPAEPQTQRHDSHQAIKLANKIADQVAAWVGKEKIKATGKIIAASDILVLVRARDRFMVALNKALKDRKIPVAGADRLVLTDHIAVKDLLALGQFILTAEDDLSLAAVLKSPLFGISETQLFTLARHRLKDGYTISLFEALGELKEEPEFAAAHEKIVWWRARADRVSVFEFFAQILGADGGRHAFYARLGPEAEDILDAFLAHALDHEQSAVPGLQAFIEQLTHEPPQIKREMDQAAGQIRVMTVHAAKGLEAPIVFLVDKCSQVVQGTHQNALYRWRGADESGYLWVPNADMHSDITLPLKEAEKAAAEEEYRRLLYVAMTRAKDHLIICGYAPKTPPKFKWHDMVATALGGRVPSTEGEQATVPSQNPESADAKADALEASVAHPLPEWINTQLPQETALPRPLTPSGAQALINEAMVEDFKIPSLLEADSQAENSSPRKRGTAIHLLLQLLPDMEPADRWEKAEKYLANTLPDLAPHDIQTILQGVRDTLEAADLEAYFNAKTSRAECAIMGTLHFAGGPRTVSGTIDRLAVLDDHIMLLDYKTSSYVPSDTADVAPDYVSQMALYRALVTKLYPQKPVHCALVYTHAAGGPRFMKLPQEALKTAYERIAQL